MPVIELRPPVAGEPTPAQRALGGGDYVLCTPPGPQFEGLVIYGYVWTRQAFIADWRADGVLEDYPVPVRPLALEWRLLVHEWRYQQGYVRGRWYSVAEPGGEEGENHVSTCRRIAEAEFLAARARGWS